MSSSLINQFIAVEREICIKSIEVTILKERNRERAKQRIAELESKMIEHYRVFRETDKLNDVYNEDEKSTGQYVATYVGDVWCSTEVLDNHKTFEMTQGLNDEEKKELIFLIEYCAKIVSE